MRRVVKRFRTFWLQDISFISLLLMLGFSIFVLPILLEHKPNGHYIQSSMFLLIFFVGIWSATSTRLVIIGAFLFTAGLLVKLLDIDNIENDFRIAEKIIFSLNALVFIFINFKLLFRDEEFNFERVIGAVNVYLLIALLGAFLFELIQLTYGSSLLAENNSMGKFIEFEDYIYFSFVSLTTVGFGDIYPGNQPARMLSVFLSTVGILFPAIVIARLVSLGKTVKIRKNL